MHTLFVIVVFFLIVFAPVLAAQAARARRKRQSDSSAAVRAYRPGPVDPNKSDHLPPRPRSRRSF